MIKSTRTLLLGLVLACPVMAAEHGEHQQHHANEPVKKTAPAGSPSATNSGMQGGMMMPGMHKHMEEMQSQMAQIRQADDPETRKSLMQEHMASMQEMMKKMHGPGGMMGRAGGMASPDATSESSMPMGTRIQHMEQRMRMMETMMQQMLEMQRMKLSDELR